MNINSNSNNKNINNSFNNMNNSNINNNNNMINQSQKNEPNSLLDEFEFIKRIGSGAFGEVNLYKNKKNNLFYAIKALPIGSVNQNDKKLFQKESKLLESINHPNIVKYYLSFEEKNNYYIVMEYCENNNLEIFIDSMKQKNERILEELIWKVAYQSLDALNYLHVEKKILHKDIKPLNILFTKNNDIKLSDFGLSGIIPIISNATTMIRVDTSKPSGTPNYLPPEIYTNNISFKSDIWSLGVSLYQMAQLEVPFPFGENEVVHKINLTSKSPKPIDKIYSKELNNLIMKMLIKDPIRRPTAKDCMLLIPKIIKNKYERINLIEELTLYNPFFPLFGLGFLKSSIPQEIKEEFNDLYSIIYEFPNLSAYNFVCPDCKNLDNKEKMFPRIALNLENLTIDSICGGGHSGQYDVKEFYKKFIDERNEIKEDVCSLCGKLNEFHPEIYYKFCIECQHVLCRNCEKEHKTNFVEHHISNNAININSECQKHTKQFSYFCEDCFLNLCEGCLEEHNSINIGHSIKEIEVINDNIINNAKKNIEDIKVVILQNEELVKKMNCAKNKHYILLKLNVLKLFVLFKYTFIKMYEGNNWNYIITKNFIDNNYEIYKPFLYKNEETIFDIFIPKLQKSILEYEKIKHEKSFDDIIVDIIPIDNGKLMIFLKTEIKLINDINTIEDISIKKIDIDNVMRLKNGTFLINHLNKLEVFSLLKNDGDNYTLNLIFEFPEFSKIIMSFIELADQKIVVLAEGYLTVFEKKNNSYEIFKNNFYLNEKIYSIIQVNEKEFVSISEIKGDINCHNCCHIQIWNSDIINVKYNSYRHNNFVKRKNNVINFKNDSILILNNGTLSTNFINSLCIFNLKAKDYYSLNLPEADELLNIFSISNNCFIASYKINESLYINQYEYCDRNPTLIGKKCIGAKEINKIQLLGERLLISEKEGKIHIYV